MIAIIIPTLNRAHKLPALLQNIKEVTKTPHRVYFVIEKTDEKSSATLDGLDCETVVGSYGSCAKAMNAGYLTAQEPYVFTGNDDLKFKEGWDTALLEAAKKFPIVGINQGDGKTTCFTLVERKFIEENSGVYDKPNALYHEYGSQYCDTEHADYAKARRVWGEVGEPLIQHEHPTFGMGEHDQTYEKNGKSYEQDMQTYQRRRKEIKERHGDWE